MRGNAIRLLALLAAASAVGLATYLDRALGLSLAALLTYSALCAHSPRSAFLVFMLYSSVHLWLSQDLGVVPTYVDDAIWYVLLLSVAVSSATKRIPLPSLRRVWRYVFWYGCATLLVAVGALSPGQSAGLWGLRDWLQYSVLPFLVIILLDAAGDLRKGYRWLLAVGLLVACLAVIGTVWPSSGLAELRGTGPNPMMLRVTSTMGNPNTLAYFLGLVTLCYMPTVWHEKSGRRIVARMMPVLLVLLVTVMTQSRSGLVLLPASIGVQWLLYLGCRGQLRQLRDHRRFVRLASLLAGILGLALLALLIAVPWMRSVPGLRLTRLSAANMLDLQELLGPRVAIWTDLLDEWQLGPLFGSGVGAVTARQSISDQVRVVDSYWLKLLLEQGIAGLLLFGALLVDLGRRAWRLCGYASLRSIGVTAITVIGYVAVIGVFSTVMDIYPLNLYLWSGAGALLWVYAHASEWDSCNHVGG